MLMVEDKKEKQISALEDIRMPNKHNTGIQRP